MDGEQVLCVRDGADDRFLLSIRWIYLRDASVPHTMAPIYRDEVILEVLPLRFAARPCVFDGHGRLLSTRIMTRRGNGPPRHGIAQLLNNE